MTTPSLALGQSSQRMFRRKHARRASRPSGHGRREHTNDACCDMQFAFYIRIRLIVLCAPAYGQLAALRSSSSFPQHVSRPARRSRPRAGRVRPANRHLPVNGLEPREWQQAIRHILDREGLRRPRVGRRGFPTRVRENGSRAGWPLRDWPQRCGSARHRARRRIRRGRTTHRRAVHEQSC